MVRVELMASPTDGKSHNSDSAVPLRTGLFELLFVKRVFSSRSLGVAKQNMCVRGQVILMGGNDNQNRGLEPSSAHGVFDSRCSLARQAMFGAGCETQHP